MPQIKFFPNQFTQNRSANILNPTALALQIKALAKTLGFAELRIGPASIPPAAQANLQAWLAAGMHGNMDYMARHAVLRCQPQELQPNALRVLSVRMDYLPAERHASWQAQAWQGLQQPAQAYVSLYARGRDYHKVLRQRLQQLATQIQELVGPFTYRAFVDSAPVLEVELGQQAGLGWRGKHTLLLTRAAGSMFFLGELFTDLPLPVDEAVTAHCGACTQCIDVCPTGAITAPYTLDARRCISYLTIENRGPIPLEWRRAIGNRIYGCDDCQLICPWNKYAQTSRVADFAVRNGLNSASLLELFAWSAQEFAQRLSGSPIRRIGYLAWLRNISVALGNAVYANPQPQIQAALQHKRQQIMHLHPDVGNLNAAEQAILLEHIDWALATSPPRTSSP